MADVAARAGVSGQTVSRVVNGSPRVDPATRERVEAAMEDLGYRLHRAARALRTGRTQTIGLVATTLATVGNSRMLQAVADAAASRGYALVVVTLGGDPIDVAFERLRDQGVDGAVVLNEATASTQGATVPDDLHLVVVDAPAADRFDVVQTAHADGAAAATRHLLGLGHRTVHLLAGPSGSFSADERERGWREALASAGADVVEPLRGDWSAASGHLLGRELPADATAVFAANDQMALGLLRALAETGRRVPEDVSVVGFDDVMDAADYRPPLSTVRQDFDALGARAVDVLVSRIEAPAAPGLVTIPAELIVRESSGPAPR
ncbi:LacI family DNA-binding transcriptional regulator [Microbacterium sp. KR10-403]|uniref:LacI family DNA-binding transcriptional regulator n=1 Tax=Microbacterium sp. KR10-403 TaxID=3158581 RepID=UPI0032E3922D